MTELDLQKPTLAEQAVQNLAPPAPRLAAQQAALQAAMAAFTIQQKLVADNKTSTTENSSQGSAEAERLISHDAAIQPALPLPKAAPRKLPKAALAQKWRETFMKRTQLLGRMTLSLVLVGTIGFIGYQNWSGNNNFIAARTAQPNKYQISNFMDSDNSSIATSVASSAPNASHGRIGTAAGAGADLAGQIASMPSQQAQPPADTFRLAEAERRVMNNAAEGGLNNAAESGLSNMTNGSAAPASSPEPMAGTAAQKKSDGYETSRPAPALMDNKQREEAKTKSERADGSDKNISDRLMPANRKLDRALSAERNTPPEYNKPAALNEKAFMPSPPPAVMTAPLAGNSNAGASVALKNIAPIGNMIAPPTQMPEKPATTPVPGSLQQMLGSDDAAMRQNAQNFGHDQFEQIKDNAIQQVADAPVSTFSLDVDTASYAFVRRSLNEGHLPPKDAVRVEEMINYFDYDYALPETRETPFKPSVTVLPTPWNSKTKLLHIGIKGFDLAKDKRPQANLVFLIDTSGSMDEPTKLPLAKNALKMLVDSLQPTDHVAIVTYAGEAGTALEPTAASEKQKIINALDNLGAGGSTAGAEGIRQAYNLAQQNFTKEGVNRVILATDGDFNVGITNPQELQGFIERERSSGIFLSVLGFGEGNYNDALMQKLAQNGNGTAAYIDNLNEARRVLIDQASRTLFPIAKDVKIQVEFNPAMVSDYRLIGYETRALQREDFNNDKIDAGDVGAGASVTALYEITPTQSDSKLVDDLRYGKTRTTEDKKTEDKKSSGEYAFLKLRYKLPNGDTSKLITTPVTSKDLRGACAPDTKCEAVSPSDEIRFATAVAGFGQLLRGGKHTGSFNYDDVVTLANSAKGKDEFGLRSEFINLVRLAKSVPALPKQR
jgi:Ca-activated chloride channel family protein